MWVLGFVLQTFSKLTKKLKVGICQCCSSWTSGVGLFLIHETDEILGFLNVSLAVLSNYSQSIKELEDCDDSLSSLVCV